MKLLIFDINGKFAHFRKFYTNSSSLTYPIPTRTALMGIIAAVMGYERDSYYMRLHSSNCGITVKKLSSNKSIMQTVNYIKADSVRLIFQPQNHTQIPLELITSKEEVSFRVYFTHNDDRIFNELKERILNKRYYYSPYFGSASFGCSLDYVDCVKGESFDCSQKVPIASVINLDYLENNSIDIFKENLLLMREKMPRDMREERMPESAASYIFEDNGSAIAATCREGIIKANYKDKDIEREEYIIFM